MLGPALAERRALDTVGQGGLFQRPAYAQVSHQPLGEGRHPFVGADLDFGVRIDGHLRAPSYQGLRPDKEAGEVVREVAGKVPVLPKRLR